MPISRPVGALEQHLRGLPNVARGREAGTRRAAAEARKTADRPGFRSTSVRAEPVVHALSLARVRRADRGLRVDADHEQTDHVLATR